MNNVNALNVWYGLDAVLFADLFLIADDDGDELLRADIAIGNPQHIFAGHFANQLGVSVRRRPFDTVSPSSSSAP